MPVTEYTKQQGAHENTEASCSPQATSKNNLSNILERERIKRHDQKKQEITMETLYQCLSPWVWSIQMTLSKFYDTLQNIL